MSETRISEGARKAAVQYLDASSLTQECGWRQSQYDELLPFIQQAIDAETKGVRGAAKAFAEAVLNADSGAYDKFDLDAKATAMIRALSRQEGE